MSRTAPHLDYPGQYAGALDGEIPGEALTTNDRRVLIEALHARGYTDAQIATHTRWTTYTVARIRIELGLHTNTTTAPTRKRIC
ncbi:hypothetical protein [Rhodococcus zopfii]|uniref:hypothetical protein n=1 Tax=Rhodococcus zopfii TaxID=43772 RepID=UPI0035273D01